METGKIVIDGRAERLVARPGRARVLPRRRAGGGEAQSFRDVKHYKRRKRWLS